MHIRICGLGTPQIVEDCCLTGLLDAELPGKVDLAPLSSVTSYVKDKV